MSMVSEKAKSAQRWRHAIHPDEAAERPLPAPSGNPQRQTNSIVAQQVTEDGVLALLAIRAGASHKTSQLGLPPDNAGGRSQIASARLVPLPWGSETDSVIGTSKRTGSRLAASRGLAAGHVKTLTAPFSTIAGPARIKAATNL